MRRGEERVTLWRHQAQLIRAPYKYLDVRNFFLIGGFGCGKTSSDVFLILSLIDRYSDHGIQVGVCGTTITLLRKTLISELERYLVLLNISYSYDKQANIMTIGRMQFVFIATETPSLIYGYNLSISIVDELDELEASKAMDAFKAIHERTRVTLPDGRKPYLVFTSTAQGYSGLYTILMQLREVKQKYFLIRGLTKDNKALDPEYVKSLYELYDENERKAYLEGYFVNLHTGRVYGDYNPDVNLIPSFDVEPFEQIFVGQDLNAGFNTAVALIKRNGRLYVVKEFSFPSIGHAPHIIRMTFPTNPIMWFPDASAKEIITGYLAEIRNEDIELRVGAQNPSVVDRVFFLNKMFKSQLLYVCSSCKDTDNALKTRQFNDKGEPEKGKGALAPDHVCDSLDYVLWRIMQSDMDFRAIWELSRSAKFQRTVELVA